MDRLTPKIPTQNTKFSCTNVLRHRGAISGFHREVDENCLLLRYYTASGGNSVPTFWDKLSVPYSVRNVGKEIALLAA